MTPEEKALDAVSKMGEEFRASLKEVAESARKNVGEADERLASKSQELEKKYEASIADLRAAFEKSETAQGVEVKGLLDRIKELEKAPQRPGSGLAPATKSVGERFAELAAGGDFKSAVARMSSDGGGGGSVRDLPRLIVKASDLLSRKAVTTTETTNFLPIDRRPGMVDMVAPPKLVLRDLIPTIPATGGTVEYIRYEGMGSTTPKSVTSITRASGKATVTVTSHGYRQWDRVLIAGANQTEYNGYRHILEIVDANSFKVAVTGSPTTPATGTITCLKVNAFGAAAVTAEGVLKPTAAMKFTRQTASLVTVPHSIEVTRQTLWHMPQLMQKIDSQLLLGLDVKIDYSSLWSASDITGLMTLPVTDTQNYAWSEGEVGDTMGDALRRARTRLEVLNRFPTGAIVGPEDWEKIELAKGSDDHYMWMPIGGPGNLPTLLWKMPIVNTPSMDAGRFLLGDFPAAASYHLGQDAQIYISDSHDTNFLKNIVTILAELEIQLVVENSLALCVGTFDSAPV